MPYDRFEIASFLWFAWLLPRNVTLSHYIEVSDFLNNIFYHSKFLHFSYCLAPNMTLAYYTQYIHRQTVLYTECQTVWKQLCNPINEEPKASYPFQELFLFFSLRRHCSTQPYRLRLYRIYFTSRRGGWIWISEFISWIAWGRNINSYYLVTE